MTFHFWQELVGHSQDVKCCAVIAPDLVFSGSRDSSVIKWQNIDGTFHNVQQHNLHESFVNSMSALSRCDSYPNGGSDKIINVVDFDFDFVRTLIGHDGNVCCLDSRIIDGELIIISGSWDKSAIIWRNFEKTITLTGHEQAIWGVKVLQNGNFLTASADKTIKLWNGSNGVCLWTFEGHSDCVRGIQVAQDETKFYSVSNDASIKIWDMNGDCISTLYGHSSFIYALAVANDRIISVGEDKCIKVWDFKECIQTIPYPCDSIWCISISSDGDFLVGGSDGQLRVFSSNPIKIPSLEEQQKYSQAVASIQIQKESSIEKDKLPTADALMNPGNKEGQVKMINNNGKVEAYQWSTNQWIKVGDVVDAVASNRKQLYEGREYDHVFDIDVEDGVVFKLPYNNNENPYTCAFSFIEKNDLPRSYLDQIANFIVKNTKNVTIGEAITANPDPFTRSDSDKFLFITSANIDGIMKKITEFNQTSYPSITADQLSLLSDCLRVNSFSACHEILSKLFQWPLSCLYPVVDLARIVALHDASLNFSFLLSRLLKDQADLDDRLIMLSARLVCNLFCHDNGCLRELQVQIIDFLIKNFNRCKDNTAFANSIHNYSVLCRKGQIKNDKLVEFIKNQ